MRILYSKKLKFSCIILLIFLPIVGLVLNSSFLNVRDSNILDVNLSTNGNPEVDLSFIPEIDYSLLNDQWYNHKIEMLIISPNDNFTAELDHLLNWKNDTGVRTIILSNSNFSLYEGRDDAEKIRNMIKSYYERENIQWVLLAGDTELIPIREVFNPDVLRYGGGQSEAIPGEYYKPTDFYYADLTGSWDSDGDGNWGESTRDNLYGMDEISWIPEVYVGRFPADTVSELKIMIDKTIKYEKSPEIGDWMNRMLLAGGVSSYSVFGLGSGEYESVLTNHIIQNYAQYEINYTHLVKEAGNLTHSNLNNFFNDGYSTVIMAGHGSPSTYYIDPSTIGYTSNDANSSSNDYMPSLTYLDACSTSSYDVNDNSLGEKLMIRAKGGAIGVVGALRVSWYFEDDTNLEMLNRGNAKLFWKEFFENKKFQQGRALYDSKVSYINSDYYIRGSGSTFYDFERKNILTYNLLGDPGVDIYTNRPVNATNPFPENIYEGQLVSIIVRDVNNSIVPNARVHFKTSDAKYLTIYADENGIGKFRLPAQANETYNVTITGHNLIPTNFSFTTLPDEGIPEIFGVDRIIENPFASDIIDFNIKAFDNYSGLESIYLLLSDNNFKSYTHFSISNGLLENQNEFTLTTDKFKPGQYSYCIVSRDYANNTQIFQNNAFKFTIPQPVIDYIIPVSLVFIVGIIGVSTFLVYKGIRRYSHTIGN